MGRGNLKINCDWGRSPQVAVKRDELVVGTATLDRKAGLIDATELVPMSPPEWDAAKQLARAWIADNPEPKQAA